MIVFPLPDDGAQPQPQPREIEHFTAFKHSFSASAFSSKRLPWWNASDGLQSIIAIDWAHNVHEKTNKTEYGIPRPSWLRQINFMISLSDHKFLKHKNSLRVVLTAISLSVIVVTRQAENIRALKENEITFLEVSRANAHNSIKFAFIFAQCYQQPRQLFQKRSAMISSSL